VSKGAAAKHVRAMSIAAVPTVPHVVRPCHPRLQMSKLSTVNIVAPRLQCAEGLSKVSGIAVLIGAFANARRHRRQPMSRIQLQASVSAEMEQALQIREDKVMQALEMAAPVPQSFQQAVTWSCTSVLQAMQSGRTRQTIYFYTGDGDGDVGGELGSILAYTEQFAKTMAGAKLLEGGKVRVIFTDMGAKAMCTTKWGDLPEELVLDYFPPVLKGSSAEGDGLRKLKEMCDAKLAILVGPTQIELPAITEYLRLSGEAGLDMTVVMINAKLLTNTYAGAGSSMKLFKEIESTLVPTVHLEQLDPPDDKPDLNSAVVTRFWPRPFSVWEENPDDPDSVDGFFLLDIKEAEAPAPIEVVTLLEASRDILKQFAKKKELQAARDKARRSAEKASNS